MTLDQAHSKSPLSELPSETGQRYWRSLEELSQTDAFSEALAPEFAGGYDPQEIVGMSRRTFLGLMAASMSLAGAGLAGCRRLPEQKLAPFTARPEGWVPGQATQYASMVELAGVANGVLVASFDGRPIKLEGNPAHPMSLGATDAMTQGLVLEMYDPERTRWVYRGKGPSAKRAGWNHFQVFADDHLKSLKQDGKKLAVLSGYSSSPTVAQQRKAMAKAYPGMTWYTYEPVNHDHRIEGARLAFGKPLRVQYDLRQANVIACFDADLLSGMPGSLAYARQWADGRRSPEKGRVNRLYAAESTFTHTGSVADERLPIQSSQIVNLLLALANKLGVPGVSFTGDLNGSTDFVNRLASDLASAHGHSLVIAGDHQPPEVHALVYAINETLQSSGPGKPVSFTDEPLAEDQTCGEAITALSRRLDAGEIDTLIVLGGNPAYDAPADLNFADKLDKVPCAIHLSLYTNETSAKCHWLLPMAHPLTSWSDGQAQDGTYSIAQPLILPLFDGKSTIEVLALLAGEEQRQGYDRVRATFVKQGYATSAALEKPWRKVLHEGVVPDSAFKLIDAQPLRGAGAHASPASKVQGLELTFHRAPGVYDGRFANNAWLQELPEALTKVTWDNVARINIKDAKDQGIKQGDLLELTVAEGGTITVPAYLMPGQAAGSIAVQLGYGRRAVAKNTLNIGTGVGFDVYPARTTGSPGIAVGVQLHNTGQCYELALTQNHYLLDAVGMQGKRDRVGVLSGGNTSGKIVKDASVDYFRKHPHFVAQGDHFGDIPLQLWDPPKEETDQGRKDWPTPGDPDRKGAPAAFNSPHAWGMSVDMTACMGCNACVIACQAENNIGVVGKGQVQMHREMHWIRTDRYFKTDPKTDPYAQNPQVAHMPVMCQHCENAPCEQVCPVAATVHDTEGLNTMVYNRCIGTRYCSNNCPYKVRRFNYFDYHARNPRGTGIPGIQAKPWLGDGKNPLSAFPDQQQLDKVNEIKRMTFNPDVTVRMRGVMEKCTYCTQRIAQAKIDTKIAFNQGKAESFIVPDGTIQTACQQVCPTQAIVFGDLNDPKSKVSQLQKNDRSYGILTELNTRPRTKYMAKIRNPQSPSQTDATPSHVPDHA